MYVREGPEFAPWRPSKRPSNEQPDVPMDSGLAAALVEHRAPIAVLRDISERSTVKTFDEWSTDTGETSVLVPLIAQSTLIGAIHLQHSQPRPYSQRQFKLLSSAAYFFGASIRLAQLENENSELLSQLETRKVVERGKGILQRDLGLTEEQAYLTLQRQSRQKRRPMKEIAQAIILSDEVRQNSLQLE